MTDYDYPSKLCKYSGFTLEMYKSEVEVGCYGLINMTEAYLGHTLTREEAVELARNTLNFYEETL